MSVFDLLVLLVLVVSGLIGWYRGGMRELVVLAAIAGGFVAIHLFGGPASSLVDGTLARLLVLGGLFLAGDIIVLIAGGSAVRRFLGKEKARSDRAAGGVFGLVRGWVLAAFLVFTVEVYHTEAPLPPSVRNSFLAEPLSATAGALLRKADVTQVGAMQKTPSAHLSPA